MASKKRKPKPREFWIRQVNGGFFSVHADKEEAKMLCKLFGGQVIHVREVVPRGK